MTWATLRDVQRQTRLDFTRELAAKHSFVRLSSGRWTRVLGMPSDNCVHVYGRIFHSK